MKKSQVLNPTMLVLVLIIAISISLPCFAAKQTVFKLTEAEHLKIQIITLKIQMVQREFSIEKQQYQQKLNAIAQERSEAYKEIEERLQIDLKDYILQPDGTLEKKPEPEEKEANDGK